MRPGEDRPLQLIAPAVRRVRCIDQTAPDFVLRRKEQQSTVRPCSALGAGLHACLGSVSHICHMGIELRIGRLDQLQDAVVRIIERLIERRSGPRRDAVHPFDDDRLAAGWDLAALEGDLIAGIRIIGVIRLFRAGYPDITDRADSAREREFCGAAIAGEGILMHAFPILIRLAHAQALRQTVACAEYDVRCRGAGRAGITISPVRINGSDLQIDDGVAQRASTVRQTVIKLAITLRAADRDLAIRLGRSDDVRVADSCRVIILIRLADLRGARGVGIILLASLARQCAVIVIFSGQGDRIIIADMDLAIVLSCERVMQRVLVGEYLGQILAGDLVHRRLYCAL